MNWNIGKNILAVVFLAFVFIGLPVLTTQYFGISEDVFIIGMTYQEVSGVGGFLAMFAALVGWYFYWRIKGGNIS